MARLRLTKSGYALGSILLLICTLSCSSVRHVPEGRHLLRRVYIMADSNRLSTTEQEELQGFVVQQPNKKIFELFKWSLGLYNLSSSEGKGWLNKRLRRWGEKPVLHDEAFAKISVNSLQTAMYNKGYLRAYVNLEIDTVSAKSVDVTYNIHRGELYRISHVEEQIQEAELYHILHPSDTIEAKRAFPTEMYTSLLKTGSPLSADLMQAERRRIVQILRNRGYWRMREEQISFDVDTFSSPLDSWVRTNISVGNKPVRIGTVNITLDTVPHSIRKSLNTTGRLQRLLTNRRWLREGDWYSEELVNRTITSLTELSAIKRLKLEHTEVATDSLPRLDVNIHIEPQRSKELNIEGMLTYSGGHWGGEGVLGIKHSNLFGASELTSVQIQGGYEALGNDKAYINYGIEGTMSIPKLALPVLWTQRPYNYKTTTDYRLSYSEHQRPEFSRRSFSASWGYSWQQFLKPKQRHSIKVLDVDYMRLGYIREDFNSSLPDITRMLYYSNQFVVAASYLYLYSSSSLADLGGGENVHNLRIYMQSAGNVLRGVSSVIGASQDLFGAYSILRTNFTQFLRAELDYSGLYRLGDKSTLAYRAAFNVVYPYLNSRILPVDLRYFSGGPNSLRGWGIRSLGPGGMSKQYSTSIFNQVGDIKVDLNLELRLRLARLWEIAVFSDAGNIWTIYPYDNQPNGDFSVSRFYREIALNTGVGFRLDLTQFILRADVGFKLHDPQMPQGERWVVGRHPLRDLWAWHFAIGYPF